MDVTQRPEQLRLDAAANVVTDQPLIDISPDASDHFYMRPLIPAVNDDRDVSFDATSFGSDGFQPYGSPSRIRMLHFRVEYRQKYVPIILQDINCVGECAVLYYKRLLEFYVSGMFFCARFCALLEVLISFV